MTVDLRTRYNGCLIGLAVGDALGTTLEFKSPGSFQPIDDMVGGGPFRLEPGQWTDDTSMALCLAESLIVTGGFDPVDQMQRYRRWYREGHLSCTGSCFDIGNTVRAAIHAFERTNNPYSGSTDPMAAGNGSTMRLAPVPLFYASNPQTAIQRSMDSSRTTHAAVTAVDACAYLASLLVGAIEGHGKDDLLSAGYAPAGVDELSYCPEVAALTGGSYKEKSAAEIKGSGYVVDSLEAALWAFNRSESFKEGALLAVNLGDDADTTGAVYGQLAGAYYGIEGIPGDWVAKVALRSLIDQMAESIFAATQPGE